MLSERRRLSLASGPISLTLVAARVELAQVGHPGQRLNIACQGAVQPQLTQVGHAGERPNVADPCVVEIERRQLREPPERSHVRDPRDRDDERSEFGQILQWRQILNFGAADVQEPEVG